MTSAEITMTFEFEYDGSNEDLVRQLVVAMRKVVEEAETEL